MCTAIAVSCSRGVSGYSRHPRHSASRPLHRNNVVLKCNWPLVVCPELVTDCENIGVIKSDRVLQYFAIEDKIIPQCYCILSLLLSVHLSAVYEHDVEFECKDRL